MRRYRFGSLVVLVIVLLCSCNQSQPALLPHKHVIVALGSAPVSLDPHYTNESISFAVNLNIYETLVRTDSELNLAPSLAQKWTNPDDLTWIFDLDPRARFHNGKRCTSADVAYSLNRVRTDPRSDWKGSLVSMDSIETPSDTRIILHTRGPRPILLRDLSAIAIVPKDAASLEEHPIGTGPYRFVSADWQAGKIELERWDGYRGAIPSIELGTFRWIEDGRERLRLLRSRKVDLVSDVPVELIREIRSDANLEMVQIPSLRVLYAAFDMKRQKSPYVDASTNPFLDRRVRLAMLKAVDRPRMVQDIFQGVNEVASQMVAPAVFGYDSGVQMPSYDLNDAKRLMAEAGYANGFGVILDTPENVYPGDRAIAEYLATSLSRIGIRVTVNPMQKQLLFEKLARRDTSFYLLSWNCLSADSQEVFTYLLHTPDAARGYGSDNSGDYSNADVDRLAEQAAQTMDSGKRLELLKAALAEVTEDVPWLPIYIQTHVFAAQKHLQWQPREDKVLLFSEMKLKD